MGTGVCYNCGICMNIDLMHSTPDGILLCPECFRKSMIPSTSTNSYSGEECPYCHGTGEDYYGVKGGCKHCDGTGIKSDDDDDDY